jgi:hypothetical protein
MSKVNGRKVTRATLTDTIFVPGIGTVGKDLNGTQSAEHSAVEMEIDEPFLLCVFRERQTKKPIEVPVPLAQVRGLVLATEVKPLPKPMLKEA